MTDGKTNLTKFLDFVIYYFEGFTDRIARVTSMDQAYSSNM